jgi:hypothetical protein
MTMTVSDRRLAPTVDQPSKLDRVARRINALCREAALEVTYSIGELIIEELYGGDIAQWGRQGTGSFSYRKLAARADLLVSPSTLCRAVAIYVLCERLGGRPALGDLTASHLQEVLALEQPEQERLLFTANAQQWTVSRLRAEVRRRRPEASRSKRASVIGAVEKLKAFLLRHQSTLTDGGALRDLDPTTANELRSNVAEVRSRLEALNQLLSTT